MIGSTYEEVSSRMSYKQSFSATDISIVTDAGGRAEDGHFLCSMAAKVAQVKISYGLWLSCLFQKLCRDSYVALGLLDVRA